VRTRRYTGIKWEYIRLVWVGVAQSVLRMSYPGVDGPGSNPSGDKISAPPNRPDAHPGSSKMCTNSFSEINCGRGVLLTTKPSSATVKNE